MVNLQVSETVNRLTTEMDKVIIGLPLIKRYSIAAMLCDQHVLLEGLPGTAKSLFGEVFQRAISGSVSVRIQLTPDVKPMDLVGVKVWNPGKAAFDFEEGPICGKNFPLFDEINRAPGRTLSAVLSAMQERRIYISGREIILPDPFFAMGTENPIEQEGVYPLPEAAVDRFGIKLIVPYATAEEEEQILDNEALDGRDPHLVVQPVVSTGEIVEIREAIKRGVFVSPAAKQYIVSLIRATRPNDAKHTEVAKHDPDFGKMIEVGSSVRGELALRGLSRVLAAIKGRSYVLPEDIQEIVEPVLCHRVALTFEARAEGRNSVQAVKTIVEQVPFSEDTDKYAPS